MFHYLLSFLQERLDFAMKEIIFDLLSVGKKFILTPEVSNDTIRRPTIIIIMKQNVLKALIQIFYN